MRALKGRSRAAQGGGPYLPVEELASSSASSSRSASACLRPRSAADTSCRQTRSQGRSYQLEEELVRRRSSWGGARQEEIRGAEGRWSSGGGERPYLLQLQRLGLHGPQPPLNLPGGGLHLPLGQAGLLHLPLELLLLGLKEHEDMM